ncbi:hypothetical protein HanPSC8_Chr05g0217751 [Helianthus annuus]|nr:hypothetical protein HanPSC8_Chr05g0217751 [Helianthus annuus]
MTNGVDDVVITDYKDPEGLHPFSFKTTYHKFHIMILLFLTVTTIRHLQHLSLLRRMQTRPDDHTLLHVHNPSLCLVSS